MLNNNAELDNGVYNEPEEKKDEKPKDELTGLDVQILSNPAEEAPAPVIDSNMVSAVQSLNNSAVMVDEEKIEKMSEMYGYQYDFVLNHLDNDELNHATTTYFLLDCEKEF